jgi:hypothetical protein
MTVEQLARSTRSVFEQRYVSLTGLPFFNRFPLNCCQVASVVFEAISYWGYVPADWRSSRGYYRGGLQ